MHSFKSGIWTGLSFLTLLTACGGGGGSADSGVVNILQISGTAATGAAIVSGNVEAKCKAGTGTAITNETGTYTISVNSGVQPCILRVTDPVTQMQLHSMVETGANTANITPATDMVVANALGENPANSFSNFSSGQQQKINATNIATAVTRVQAATAVLGSSANMSEVDIMKGPLRAATADSAGDAADQKLDALMAALASADKRISELSALLATATSNAVAANRLTSLIGSAQFSLTSCPVARSGDVWVLDFLGTLPLRFNADFNTMLLKNLSDNSTALIFQKRDAQNAVIPCAFTATVSGESVEFRVTDGGVGIWKSAINFGITVPAQTSRSLTDLAFVGHFPAAGFLRDRNSNVRAALPFKFIVTPDGNLQGYACDVNKPIPDCTTALDGTSPDDASCTPMSNGTLSCTSSNGLRATAVLYGAAGQTSIFMAVTQLPIDSYNFGGLVVMTKASPMKLPAAGQGIPAGNSWFVGVKPGSFSLAYGDSSAGTIDSVDPTTRSYTTTPVGGVNTYTRFINTPSEGLGFSVGSDGTRSVTIGSSTGWSMTMVRGNASTVYDGWFAYARAKR